MKFLPKRIHDTNHETAVRSWMRSARPEGLTEEEHARGRAYLSEYAAMRPARAPMTQPFPRVLAFAWSAHARSFSAAIAAVVVIVGAGSTAYAAEGALPGQPLYPIKINVNEQVEGALALSDQSKAEWSLTRAERRLEEASTLALTDGLTPDARAELQQNLNASLADAESRADGLKESDPVAASDIAISANAMLQAHAVVLAAIETTVPDTTKTELGSLLADVTTRIASSAAEPALASAAATDTSVTIVNAQKAAAKNRIDSAQELLSAATGNLNLQLQPKVDIWSGAEAQLRAAQAAYASGEGSAQDDDNSAASGNFNTALSAASGAAATVSARVHVLDVLEQTGALAASATTSGSGASANATTSAAIDEDEAASSSATTTMMTFSAMMRVSSSSADAASTSARAPSPAPSAPHHGTTPDGVSASSILDALQDF